MDQKAQQIIVQISQLFMQYGIKSLTMDDIARHLGMSKKTLYQYFSDKADLVEKCIETYMNSETSSICSIQESSENAIEEMFRIAQHVSQHLQSLHPSILYDLEKYYPVAFSKFNEYKTEVIMSCIAKNLELGIEQGYYRDSINVPILAGLYVGRMDIIFDQELFPSTQYSAKDVYFEAIRYHIRGVANAKGIAYLKDKIKTLDTQNPIF